MERSSRNTAQDWEAILAEEGMPSELERPDEIPSGDALDVADPESAAARAEDATIEDDSEAIFDSPTEVESE